MADALAAGLSRAAHAGRRDPAESMAPGGVILPEYYIQLVTMHGTFMVFFAIMPLLVGVYANFLIPLKIGTHDMAFRASTCGRSGRSSRPGW